VVQSSAGLAWQARVFSCRSGGGGGGAVQGHRAHLDGDDDLLAAEPPAAEDEAASAARPERREVGFWRREFETRHPGNAHMAWLAAQPWFPVVFRFL
jgi:hypothetical protein